MEQLLEGSWGADCMKAAEGSSQNTHIHDPWTRTVVWGLPEGWGAGWRWAMGEKVGVALSINNKIQLKMFFRFFLSLKRDIY